MTPKTLLGSLSGYMWILVLWCSVMGEPDAWGLIGAHSTVNSESLSL